MPKSKRKTNRKLKCSYKKRNNYKTRSKKQTPSPSPSPDKCCICEKNINGKFLHPGRCFRENMNLAHKVCEDCWFKPDGFATEGVNHACPGCAKEMPLCKKIKQIKQPVLEDAMIIDLT